MARGFPKGAGRLKLALCLLGTTFAVIGGVLAFTNHWQGSSAAFAVSTSLWAARNLQ